MSQLSIRELDTLIHSQCFSTTGSPSISPNISASSENTGELRHYAIIETMISAEGGCNGYRLCAVLHAIVLWASTVKVELKPEKLLIIHFIIRKKVVLQIYQL